MRVSVQSVNHPVCCVLDIAVTYARDSSCCFLRRAFCPLEGGGGGETHGKQNESKTCRLHKRLSLPNESSIVLRLVLFLKSCTDKYRKVLFECETQD